MLKTEEMARRVKEDLEMREPEFDVDYWAVRPKEEKPKERRRAEGDHGDQGAGDEEGGEGNAGEQQPVLGAGRGYVVCTMTTCLLAPLHHCFGIAS